MKLLQEIIVLLLLLVWDPIGATATTAGASRRRNLRANFSLEIREALAMAVQSALESSNGKVDQEYMDYAISLGLDRNTVLKSAALELRKNGDPYASENRIKAKIPKSIDTKPPPGYVRDAKSKVGSSSYSDPSTVSYKVDDSRIFYEDNDRDNNGQAARDEVVQQEAKDEGESAAKQATTEEERQSSEPPTSSSTVSYKVDDSRIFYDENYEGQTAKDKEESVAKRATTTEEEEGQSLFSLKELQKVTANNYQQ